MATFHISRKGQFSLITDGCNPYSNEAKMRMVTIAQLVKECLPDQGFDPTDTANYDLSLLLEKLSDDEHADVFEAYLNLVP